MQHIVVLGSGFAGLWSAIGAARRLAELGVGPDTVRVTVISSQPFHDIRVRNYEQDISACRIPSKQCSARSASGTSPRWSRPSIRRHNR